jgi:hypothetical protein
MAANKESTRFARRPPQRGQSIGASASRIDRRASNRSPQSSQTYSYSGIVDPSNLVCGILPLFGEMVKPPGGGRKQDAGGKK